MDLLSAGGALPPPFHPLLFRFFRFFGRSVLHWDKCAVYVRKYYVYTFANMCNRRCSWWSKSLITITVVGITIIIMYFCFAYVQKVFPVITALRWEKPLDRPPARFASYQTAYRSVPRMYVCSFCGCRNIMIWSLIVGFGHSGFSWPKVWKQFDHVLFG